ncbi:signal transduction histidine kinase [Sulfurimonas gotlandica GD1]|uniref:histidine kinase n=1 Tax=Sulfurimonas gotlandica (strain DSM 19862 / JCM 16533 / GD1) TaxID=929558 RepID=B6BGM8_SULGG|nr:sensor histidine kinase [Sulfurimonas gotlandica]EDZ63385.1 ATPase, histidine kinase-, DNA gyrase B-, and HSP90-like domain protein [Sulfurimonas gotlandica GD1]EHP29658.1 signal transduction histidine kinase [Sulfurimonas gotlandica GD1]
MNSFKNKLLLSYITYGLALGLVAIFTVNKIQVSHVKEQYIINTVDQLTKQKAFLKNYTNNIEKKLFVIRDSKIFKQYLHDNSDSDISDLFTYIVNTSEDVMQLRYIDKNGFEKVRIDKTEKEPTPKLITSEELQDKSNRYYFKEIIAIDDKAKSWYSKIDLNIEHNQIEKPIKPVLRVGIPIFVENEKVGILIINISMKYFLNQISSVSLYNIYLIDNDGDFIIHPEKNRSWGKYLDTKYSVKNHFEDSYQSILNKDKYIGEGVYSALIDLDNGENIKMIIEPKYHKFKEQSLIQIYEMAFIMFLMILGSFPVAYTFSSRFGNLKAKVDRLKDSLEISVEEKTKKLQKLNETLEQRIEEEVKKNTEKEKQLLYQNRLAKMGEMISMIAHQWRQPLAAISSTVGAMKIDVMMGNYEKEFFEKSLGKITDYTQHLSATIDDFRGFFKDQKEEDEITLEEVVESSLGILSPTLIDKNIKLVKEYKCQKRFTSYSNELKQVVLNLIKNAEDVLLERNIINPTIYIKTYIQEDSHKYILEINDNAGGVPENIMNDIFMPYFSTKKSKDGTGLGLYMSKTIIEDHCHGKLSVKNNHVGAVFTIELSDI